MCFEIVLSLNLTNYFFTCLQIMFHVATMMVPEAYPSDGVIGTFASMKKKRHIGNDFVHIVFKVRP